MLYVAIFVRIAYFFRKWKEEEEIYSMLHKYYNKQVEMLVPAIKPGFSYPFEIVDFYNTLKNRVNKYLLLLNIIYLLFEI